jgi:ubiquitin C-terminal hydrolase
MNGHISCGVMGGLSSKQIPNEFFPAHVLVNQWERTQKKSGYWGLTNLGNTCFLNSVLQCICGTATLVNTCHADSPDSHTKLIERQGLDRDWICTVEAAINKLQTEPTSSQALKPTPFTNKISEIMKSHRKGEQVTDSTLPPCHANRGLVRKACDCGIPVK